MLKKIRSFFIVFILCTAIVALLWNTLDSFFSGPKKVKTISCATFEPPIEITDFNLNEVFSEKKFNKQSLKGHWNLIFFGYTTCPDICPNTLEIIKDVWYNLEKHYIPIKFIFITLNPEEDSNKKIKKFLIKYNNNFLGLNGDYNQILLLKKSLGVYAKSTIKNGENLINHSGILLLINPQGKLYAIFSPPLISKNIKNDLINIIYN